MAAGYRLRSLTRESAPYGVQQYAIRAFEAGAVDYLLKPVSRDGLLQAVERVSSLRRDPVAVAEGSPNYRSLFPAPITKSSPFGLEEILAFQATGHVVCMITGEQSNLVTGLSRQFADRLKGSEEPGLPITPVHVALL